MSKTKIENFELAGAVEYKGQALKCEFLYGEEKLDGMRMPVIMRHGKGTAYTRGGCENVNARRIIEELESRPALFRDCVLDGEAVILDKFGIVDFNLTQSVCMTESPHPEAKRLRFRTFDYISLGEWDADLFVTPLRLRKIQLRTRIKRLASDRITLVPYETIPATERAMQTHLRAMVRKGVEGGVYKDPEGVYRPGKSTKGWLKLKPYQECDAEVIGMKPGKKGKTGQMLGLIGSLDLKTVIDGKKITWNSSGISMRVRKQLTALHKKKKLVGLIVEVRHEGVTVKNKVRFPRITRVRFDKDKI